MSAAQAQDATAVLKQMRAAWGIAAMPPTGMSYMLATERYADGNVTQQHEGTYRLYFAMRVVHYTEGGRVYELTPDSVRQLSGPSDGLSTVQLDAKYMQRLRNTLAYNFLYMIQRPDWQYSYVRASEYAGQAVHILRASWVGPASWQIAPIDLFVSVHDFTILTSSQPDAQGNYPYYADEADYARVGPNHLFPHRYRVVAAGQVQTEGKFSDVMVSVR